MTMRSVSGGQFFAYSEDRGQSWSRPVLSPLRGACSPAAIQRVPGTADVLALWTYGLCGRTPLVSALSSDAGRSWRPLKLVERSRHHGYCYCYTSITFHRDHVLLTYCHPIPSWPDYGAWRSSPATSTCVLRPCRSSRSTAR